MGILNYCRDASKIRTTILIDKSDYDFMKEKHYKATALLRVKIQELKARARGESVDYKLASEKIRNKFDKLLEKLAEILTDDQFKAILEN